MQTRFDGSTTAAASATLGGFFKHTRSYPMFAMVEQVRRFDDYGEQINADDYMEASALPLAPLPSADGAGARRPGLWRPGMDGSAVPPSALVAAAAAATAAAASTAAAAAAAAAAGSAEAAQQEPPTKAVAQDVQVVIACRVSLFEMEGLADAVSAQTIIERVAPRKLVRAALAQGRGAAWSMGEGRGRVVDLGRCAALTSLLRVMISTGHGLGCAHRSSWTASWRTRTA